MQYRCCERNLRIEEGGGHTFALCQIVSVREREGGNACAGGAWNAWDAWDADDAGDAWDAEGHRQCKQGIVASNIKQHTLPLQISLIPLSPLVNTDGWRLHFAVTLML